MDVNDDFVLSSFSAPDQPSTSLFTKITDVVIIFCFFMNVAWNVIGLFRLNGLTLNLNILDLQKSVTLRESISKLLILKEKVCHEIIKKYI